MFTGLIEALGRLRSLRPEEDGARLTVEAPFAAALHRGESVAVDGVCLTVVTSDASSFEAIASGETLRRTALGCGRRPGAPVNLERALALGDRLGGSLVQGHVDGTGRIVSIEEQGKSHIIRVSAPPEILNQLVEKGSVAVDGISLTIASLEDDSFSVWIIPETWTATTLRFREVGEAVNLESDLIAKYVFRYLETRRECEGGSISRDAALSTLLEQGGWLSRSAGRNPV